MGLDDDSTEEDARAALVDLWERVTEDPRVRWANGQLEVGDGGRLHGQCYIEFNASLRNTQVRKVLPGMASHRRRTRTHCKDYCSKPKGRLHTLADFGEWRDDTRKPAAEGPKARALNMLIRDGMSPAEIAKQDPGAFFQFHAAIKATWKALEDFHNGRE